MRLNRTPEDWRAIIEEQQHSGLNQSQFCRLHSITRSAFFNAKQRLYPTDQNLTAFIPAVPPAVTTSSATDAPPIPASAALTPCEGLTSQRIILKLPHCTLQIESGVSPRWLATLIREMAP
ncbi:MAG: hypothetical protein VB135_03050 [Burkholderia sp.]